jgi:hypothetical protein
LRVISAMPDDRLPAAATMVSTLCEVDCEAATTVAVLSVVALATFAMAPALPSTVATAPATPSSTRATVPSKPLIEASTASCRFCRRASSSSFSAAARSSLSRCSLSDSCILASARSITPVSSLRRESISLSSLPPATCSAVRAAARIGRTRPRARNSAHNRPASTTPAAMPISIFPALATSVSASLRKSKPLAEAASISWSSAAKILASCFSSTDSIGSSVTGAAPSPLAPFSTKSPLAFHSLASARMVSISLALASRSGAAAPRRGRR